MITSLRTTNPADVRTIALYHFYVLAYTHYTQTIEDFERRNVKSDSVLFAHAIKQQKFYMTMCDTYCKQFDMGMQMAITRMAINDLKIDGYHLCLGDCAFNLSETHYNLYHRA